MQNFWWRALWPLVPAGFICLLAWFDIGWMPSIILLASSISLLLLLHVSHLHKLVRWLAQPDIASIPEGSLLWDDVFSHLYRKLREYARNEARLTTSLERLQQAATALPDGVIILNESDHIEWCNPTAEQQLGLNLRKDVGQPIGYLVRQREFTDYLTSELHTTPLTFRPSRNQDLTIELRLVPFAEKQTLMICRDITHLERIETMRRDFVANVSHELRTPLTVVGGFLETLKDIEGAVPESLRHYFDLMEDQTSRMRNLVGDLLTLSQLESSQNRPQESIIDVHALLQTIQKEGQNISAGRHRIVIEKTSASLKLRGSIHELHSAFGNLVNNAVRYTPEGGKIRLDWQVMNSQAVFSVKDTGIGIEPQHIERLTERFYRVDRSRSRETGGTGLGLSIVKHILTRHQAHLEINSTYGKGSTFSAVFPEDRIVIEAAPSLNRQK